MAGARFVSMTPGEVKGQSAKLLDETEQFKDKVTRLYSEVNDLTSAAWQGVASRAFRAHVDNRREIFNRLDATLRNFCEFLNKAADAYKNLDESQAGKLK